MSYKHYYSKSKTKLLNEVITPSESVIAALTGRGFKTNFSGFVNYVPDGAVSGRGFATNFTANGGGSLTGRGFSTNFSSTSLETNDAFLVGGRGFLTEPILVGYGIYEASLTGHGFKTEFKASGGGVVTGRGFNTDFSATAVSPDYATLVGGRGFTQNVFITGYGNTHGSVTGRGFLTRIIYSKVTGRGFKTLPVLTGINAVIPGAAFVMNIHTGEVTRYTNYNFSHIIFIGGNPYGVKSTGLYLLKGADDDGTVINGNITTKETDFGVYQSKNVPYVYLNSDTETSVTTYSDGTENPAVTSDFSGRKAKLSKGAKARYWQVKIENIKSIDGLEFIPTAKQRRVK